MEIDKPSTIEERKLSDDIDLSMSDLELLANKKKVQGVQQEIPVEDILSNSKSTDRIKQTKKSPSKRSDRATKKKAALSTMSYSTSDSTTVSTKEQNKNKQKKINKENKDDTIRREKSTYLYKIDLMNQKKRLSQIKLDMNCTLE